MLLRNEGGLLPLDGPGLGTLAVLGPNAAAPRYQGGGSGRVDAAAGAVSPLAGLTAALGRTRVRHCPGALPEGPPTPLDGSRAHNPLTDEPGVLVRFLDGDGRELHAEHRPDARVVEP
ncbi:glycoside hydrolase family 3 C-terminal domain-containing protein [Streptomyces sp. TRM 70351]|uniref:glycoside hydrolase family 3 C-terminal domain-containing protein n=1 Tax=Streptomyces sp. TRM 70351 TaxID=3116552 RepID=UPI002E7B6163|nr:glycoside hydrolase family 3 C-terminal domain-containing protein [Streptomyces sp. TRM 70351]MEE1928933.1 glycoside hydrolase family 3 C-terminal domain-containing protein [Streptomyces sp. TRM 70351]